MESEKPAYFGERVNFMYNKLMTIGLVLLLLGLSAFADDDSHLTSSEGPQFHINTAVFATPNQFDLSRLNVYIETAYDELQFVKQDTGFIAEYEVSLILFDDDDNQIDGKILQESVEVDSFQQTNTRSVFDFAHYSFDSEPGKYKLSVSVEDNETGKMNTFEQEIELEDFTEKDIALSDLLFTDAISMDSHGIKSISPIVTDPYKGLFGTIYAYFEIYNNNEARQVDIEYRVEGQNRKFKFVDQYTKKLNLDRTLEVIKIPADSMKADEYTMTIQVKNGDEDKTSRSFFIRWLDMPMSVRDIDAAIEQLRYVASDKEWDKLKNAPEEKKVEYFKEFWNANDPTPGTTLNEAMELHYNRVEYANKHFSTMNRPGWRTDMGMVFIILGPPDEVYRNDMPRSRPYPSQVWQYYRYNRYFEYYDPTGFGDFRLTRPVSIYEIKRLLDR